MTTTIHSGIMFMHADGVTTVLVNPREVVSVQPYEKLTLVRMTNNDSLYFALPFEEVIGQLEAWWAKFV